MFSSVISSLKNHPECIFLLSEELLSQNVDGYFKSCGKRGRLVPEHAEFFQDELLVDGRKGTVRINLYSASPESELIVRSHIPFLRLRLSL